MSDLTYVQRTDEVKIVGQDSVGTNTNAVNADTNGNLLVKNYATGTTGATAPVAAQQIGGVDVSGNLAAVAVKGSSTSPGSADNALVVVISPNQGPLPTTSQPANTTPGLAFGDVSLTSALTSALTRTTYTEQTSNFTGSIVSSSANDASAGTGARQVKITYVNATGATAGTETVTLNGTTPVNLVTTTKCFIEKMEVTSVGSGGLNAGTITLKTGAAGAGTTVGTIATGDNRTFWAHHYVISGKTCNITSASHGNTSTSSGGTSVAVIKYLTIGVATAPESQVSDFVTVAGASNQVSRNYGSVVQVAGPARVRMYVTTSSNSTVGYRGSFDFYDI